MSFVISLFHMCTIIITLVQESCLIEDITNKLLYIFSMKFKFSNIEFVFIKTMKFLQILELKIPLKESNI